MKSNNSGDGDADSIMHSRVGLSCKIYSKMQFFAIILTGILCVGVSVFRRRSCEKGALARDIKETSNPIHGLSTL